MTTTAAIELADSTTKSIVYGYCLIIQKLLTNKHNDNTFYIIPTHIIHICLSYYFIAEQFIKFGNKYIQFLEEGTTIESPEDAQYDTAYGLYEIDCNDPSNANKLFRWKFDIYDDADRCNAIGIDENASFLPSNPIRWKKQRIINFEANHAIRSQINPIIMHHFHHILN